MENIASEGGVRSPKTSTLTQAFTIWLRIGLLSFGGPAAQIALMHREIVNRKAWLNEKQYLDALSFCMLLPGPEAMQLATYVGWRLHGTPGGLVAGLLFVVPGATIMLALALIYGLYGSVPLVTALFLGVKAAVIVVVIEALLRVSKRALLLPLHWVVAAVAFFGIFFLALPFPLIITAAAVFGFIHSKANPPKVHDAPVLPSFSNGLTTALIWLAVWIAPFGFLIAYDPGGILLDIAQFFSKLAVVTFGGAYAVLAYLGQDVVTHYGWLSAGEMMDGLGLAETTPGPLILVNEFVGFLAGFREAGIGYGMLAAGIALWMTFVPCFLWIFVGAPYIDWIGAQSRLRGALTAVTAAVVGVILNLSIWFALHVFFAEVTLQDYGVFVVWQPDPGSLDSRVIPLTLLSAILLFRLRWGVARTLALSSLGGIVLSSFG